MPNDDSTPAERAMVERYQCPGCLFGPDVTCGKFAVEREGIGIRCGGHRLGTMSLGRGRIFLGLPKGFNRKGAEGSVQLRMFPPETPSPAYNKLNVAVWAMEHEGDLLVRTYCPRVNKAFIDIVAGGCKAAIAPDAIDVREFYDEID